MYCSLLFFFFFFFKQKTAYEIMPSLVGSEMCIRDSLFPWSTRFLDVFIEKAEHPFYRALGELARLTLAQWQSQLLIPVAVKPLFR